MPPYGGTILSNRLNFNKLKSLIQKKLCFIKEEPTHKLYICFFPTNKQTNKQTNNEKPKEQFLSNAQIIIIINLK